MEPLQNKNAETVGRATKRAARELTGDDGNFVVTTDLGNEFVHAGPGVARGGPLPCESVQLPRVPHVEVVGQVPQRLHLALLPQKGACASVTECSEACTHLLLAPKKGLSKVPRMRGGLLVAPKRGYSRFL